MNKHKPQQTCGGQRTTPGSWVSLSTTYVLGIKDKSVGWMAPSPIAHLLWPPG